MSWRVKRRNLSVSFLIYFFCSFFFFYFLHQNGIRLILRAIPLILWSSRWRLLLKDKFRCFSVLCIDVICFIDSVCVGFILSILVPKVTMHIRNRCIRLYPQTLLILLVLIDLPGTLSPPSVIWKSLIIFTQKWWNRPPYLKIIMFLLSCWNSRKRRETWFILSWSRWKVPIHQRSMVVSTEESYPSLTSIALNNTSFSKGSDLTECRKYSNRMDHCFFGCADIRAPSYCPLTE